MALGRVIGCSQAHDEIVRQIRHVANFDAEVLITGATGTGKEVYARLLHASSARALAPFVPVNCGALPGELFENEMFGHAGGAFTGARVGSHGLIAEAEGGTLFLDEVDTLSLASQVKLLRFVQLREYRRLGEPRIRQADVRIVSATNSDLSAAVEQLRFREDLYFRLRVIPIVVPPLRSRRDDIKEFVLAFCEMYASAYKAPELCFSREAWSALERYHWPGNVRELENCIRCLTCLHMGRPVEPADLPFAQPCVCSEFEIPDELFQLPMREAKRKLIQLFEPQYLSAALRASKGNISRAARASRKDRRAFYELMRRYGLQTVNRFEKEVSRKAAVKESTLPARMPAARMW